MIRKKDLLEKIDKLTELTESFICMKHKVETLEKEVLKLKRKNFTQKPKFEQCDLINYDDFHYGFWKTLVGKIIKSEIKESGGKFYYKYSILDCNNKIREFPEAKLKEFKEIKEDIED